MTETPELPDELNLQGYPAILLDPLMLGHPAFTKVSAEGFRAQIHLMAVAWRNKPACSLPNVPDTLAFHARLTLTEWSRISADVLEHWLPAGAGRIWFPPMLEAAKLAFERRDKSLSDGKHRARMTRARKALRELGVQLQDADLTRAAAQFLEALAARGISEIRTTSPKHTQIHLSICSQLGILPDGSVHDATLEIGMRGRGTFRRLREPP